MRCDRLLHSSTSSTTHDSSHLLRGPARRSWNGTWSADGHSVVFRPVLGRLCDRIGNKEPSWIPFLLIVILLRLFSERCFSGFSFSHVYHGRTAHTALLWEVRSHALHKMVAASRLGKNGWICRTRSRSPYDLITSIWWEFKCREQDNWASPTCNGYCIPLRLRSGTGISWYLWVTGKSTNRQTGGIRHACLISSPRRRQWKLRNRNWAAHASRVRPWRNLREDRWSS